MQKWTAELNPAPPLKPVAELPWENRLINGTTLRQSYSNQSGMQSNCVDVRLTRNAADAVKGERETGSAVTYSWSGRQRPTELTTAAIARHHTRICYNDTVWELHQIRTQPIYDGDTRVFYSYRFCCRRFVTCNQIWSSTQGNCSINETLLVSVGYDLKWNDLKSWF